MGAGRERENGPQCCHIFVQLFYCFGLSRDFRIFRFHPNAARYKRSVERGPRPEVDATFCLYKDVENVYEFSVVLYVANWQARWRICVVLVWFIWFTFVSRSFSSLVGNDWCICIQIQWRRRKSNPLRCQEMPSCLLGALWYLERCVASLKHIMGSIN